MEKLEAEKLIRLTRQISEIVSSPADLQKALDATVNMLQSVLEAEVCSIMLLEGDTGELRLAASSDIPRDQWSKIRARLGEGFAGKVAQTGRPLLVREADDTSHLDEERRRRYTSRSFMCAPMKVKGKTVGVINVTNRRDHEPFTREQLDMVASVANLVALAIENANLLISTETIRRRLRDVLEALGDGVIAVDPDRRILHHNELALRYLGLKTGQCLGLRLDEVLPEKLRPVFQTLHDRTLAEHEHLHQDMEWRAEGTTDLIPLTLSTTPLYRDACGRLTGVVFVIHDMTLHRRIDELKRIDEAKNNFLAIVSHELRTPLTSIKGAIHLLRQRLSGEMPPENRELFRIVETNAERLLQQIINLLDVVNIENRMATLTLQRMRPSVIAQRCLARVRELAERKQVTVMENYEDDPGPLLVDEEKITRALGHLIENAVKFTPRGGRVVVTTGRIDGEVFVSVRDTGPGIDPGIRARMFHKFVQAEGPLTRQTGGFGVGLFVARAFAELHGGRIETGNIEGGGCEFRLILPAADIEEAAYDRPGNRQVRSSDSVGSS